MTYHSQLNLIMLATVIGLAVFLYLKPQFQSAPDEAFQISVRTPETVQTIRIMRRGHEIALARNANSWHLEVPFFARADEEQIDKLLNILSAHSRQRFLLNDAESFNLDHPIIELYFDDDYYAFGGLAPVTNEQYLAINEHVYLVSPRYAVWVPVNPLDLVNQRLLAEDEMPVKFELGDLILKKQNGAWHLDSEETDNQNNVLLARWVEKWRYTHATELLVDMQDYADYQSIVKISLEDGREIDLNAIENESETVFKRSGEQVGYLFSEQMGRQLLNPFAIEPE